jgi:ABC-type glycerol-3-phosphate transport system substrate-binding protein
MAAMLALGARGAALATPAERGRLMRALAQGDVTLDVFVHANHPFDDVKPIYEAKYPGVTLNMMEQNDVAVLRSAFAAEGEGAPDIFWPEIEFVQEFGKTDVLMDVTDLVKKHEAELAAGKTAECLIASTGRYAAFPGDIATMGLYYRQDLLDQAGVVIPEDWTWDEFAEAAKAVKDKTGAASLYLSTAGDRNTAWLFTFILMQLGGAITNADGTEVTLDDEKGIAAMEQTKRLYEADVAVDEDQFGENYFVAIQAGQVAMGPHAVWYRGFAIEPNATDEQSGFGQWRVALLPRPAPEAARTANLGGAAIASTKWTEHPQEVQNFMETALGTMEGAQACGEWGILPPYLPYLESEAWTSYRSPAFGDTPINEVWTQAVAEYPGTWYKQPVFAEALEEIGLAMMPMLEGSTDIPTGMKEVGDRVRELNARYQTA